MTVTPQSEKLSVEIVFRIRESRRRESRRNARPTASFTGTVAPSSTAWNT